MEPVHRILCIDDDKDDLGILKEAFASLQKPIEIVEACNGEEGVDELNKLDEAGKTPCLVILDINMPKMDGREAVNTIKGIDKFKDIPLIVFSTSSSPLDKMFFTRKNINYYTKPTNFPNLKKMVSEFLELCEHHKSTL